MSWRDVDTKLGLSNLARRGLNRAVREAEPFAPRASRALKDWTDSTLPPARKSGHQDLTAEVITAARKRRFVDDRVKVHRDAYLRYELWLTASTNELSDERLEQAIGSETPQFSAPVLTFLSSDWVWKRGELESIAREVVTGLSLPWPSGDRKPTDKACDACRDWARREAKRRLHSN